MKKHPYIMRTLKITTLFLAVALFVGLSQEYLFKHHDDSSIRLDGFYLEDKDSLDVVFLGASEVSAGFSSSFAYDKYGFTSYPFSIDANKILLYKSQLKEILKYQKPKLIVVEINGALYDENNINNNNIVMRKYVDNIPMSINKINTISELNPKKSNLTYYLPIIKYHNTWKKFPKNLNFINSKISSQIRGYNILRGIVTSTTVAKNKKEILNDQLVNDVSSAPLHPELELYFRDFLQYCKDENINNILFVRFPHRITKKTYNRFQKGNRVGEIINEYGYDYLNFETVPAESKIDLYTDFYNDDHMNIYGAKKFTEYLGGILCEKYGITPGNLTSKQKKEWEKSADYYKKLYQYADENIKNGKRKYVFEDTELIKQLEKIQYE